MNATHIARIGVVPIVLLAASCDRGEVSFSADVQPILENHCAECHDGTEEGATVSGFSVRDYEEIMRGTRFGAMVIPGSSISSTLYLVVAQKTAPEIQMPPHHPESLAEGRGQPLSDEDVTTIATWIDQGALNN